MPPLVAETVSDHKVSYRGLRGWLDEVSRMRANCSRSTAPIGTSRWAPSPTC